MSTSRLRPDRDWIAAARQRRAERDRERKQVRREREELITLLGSRCAVVGCAVDDGFAFDHVVGITWNIRSVNQRTRIRKIRAEWEAGVPIRLLCRKHSERHNPKGGRPLDVAFHPLVAPPENLPVVPF